MEAPLCAAPGRHGGLRGICMRTTSVIIAGCLLSGALGTGCSVARNVAKTIVIEPAHYSARHDGYRLKKETLRAADVGWQNSHGAGGPYSPDFCAGFKEGYADYLQFGGNGEPPAVPPRHYWGQMSPQGRAAAQEWFAGFRVGSAQARQEGMRETIIVPVSTSALVSEPCEYGYLWLDDPGETSSHRPAAEVPITRTLWVR